jgi:hypothetical protein
MYHLVSFGTSNTGLNIANFTVQAYDRTGAALNVTGAVWVDRGRGKYWLSLPNASAYGDLYVFDTATSLIWYEGILEPDADTATIISRLPSALVGGKMDSYAGTLGDNSITAQSIAAGAITAAKIVAHALDSSKFGVETGTYPLHAGQIGSGSTTTEIKLAAAASSVNDYYKGAGIKFFGSGDGQSGLIIAYDGTTKVATLKEAVAVAPAQGDIYSIFPAFFPPSLIDAIEGAGSAPQGTITTVPV